MNDSSSTGWLAKTLGPLAVVLLVVSAAPDARAVELRGMGGMGVNFWFMDVDLGLRAHRGVGVGVAGRVHLKIGPYLRVQAGLIQGRFTEDDDSHLKRNLIYGAVEGVYHFGRRTYVTGGLRLGADHVSLTETRERLDVDLRMVADLDRWSVLFEPFLTIGLQLAEKYHFELETGAALVNVDGQIRITYIITAGIFFRMGGRS